MVQTTQHAYNNVLHYQARVGTVRDASYPILYALLIASFAVGDQLYRTLTEALGAACPYSLLMQNSAAA